MQTSTPITQHAEKHLNPWIVMIPVMLSVFMFALDETISNVALPYMAGSFSISHNESTWIITSYLVASGIVIPAVDFFSKLGTMRSVNINANDIICKSSAGYWRRRNYAYFTGNNF